MKAHQTKFSEVSSIEQFIHHLIPIKIKISKSKNNSVYFLLQTKNDLWKKESNEIDALYIDLLGLETQNEHLIDHMLRHTFISNGKNDELSIAHRDKGNEFFRKKIWRIAMEFYNASLRYASNGSENISLAYANRSATFFHMKLYDQCLIDIGLAKKANYPQRLMHKLNEREAACMQQMKEKSTKVQTAGAEPALSFGADEKYPSMANVLEIRQNAEFGKHMVAKDDIAVGQTIVLEDVFCVGVFSDDRAHCSTCLKFVRNFIPCPNCSHAMFCGAACMESNEIHKIDCNASYHWSLDSQEISLVKSILSASSAFTNADDLMAFVQRCLISRDDDDLMTQSLTMAQLKYGQFLKLLAEPKEVDENSGYLHLMAYRHVMKIPAIRQRFNTKPKQRFLMHLIWQHYLIQKTNSWSYQLSITKCYVHVTAHLPSFFNHSCYPNVFVTMHGMQQIAITIRPVKKGEQLFAQYRNIHDDGTNFTFICKCSKCQPCYNTKHSIQMQMDSKFRYILTSKPEDFWDEQKFSTIKSKCIEFLTEYGRGPWSKEIECIWIKYTHCLDHDYFRF